MTNKRIYIFILSLFLSINLNAETLSLDSCLTLARRNNAEIRKADIHVQQAEQVKKQVITEFFPHIQGTAAGFHSLQPLVDIGIDDIGNATIRDLLLTLYGNYGAALGLNSSISLFQHGMTAGVTAIQPICVGGKIITGTQLAQLGIEAAKYQQLIAERDLTEQVEQYYWLVVGLNQKRSTLTSAISLLDTLSSAVGRAVEVGLALRTDLMQVEIKQAELHRTAIQLENAILLSTHALCNACGMPYQKLALDTLPAMDMTSIESLPMMGVGHTPEQDLLALQVEAAKLEKRMMVADALPHIALGANYGYSHLDASMLRNGLGKWNGALFVTMSVPLTDWWKTGHRIKEKSLAVQAAQITETDLNEKLNMQLEQAYHQLIEASMLVHENLNILMQNEHKLQLMQANYKAGLSTISDLLQSETDCLKASNELCDARTTYLIRLHRYHHLLGE